VSGALHNNDDRGPGDTMKTHGGTAVLDILMKRKTHEQKKDATSPSTTSDSANDKGMLLSIYF